MVPARHSVRPRYHAAMLWQNAAYHKCRTGAHLSARHPISLPRPEGRFFDHSEGYPQVAEIRFAKCRLLYRREADVRRNATIGLPFPPSDRCRSCATKKLSVNQGRPTRRYAARLRRDARTRAEAQIVRSDERNWVVYVHVSLLGGRFPPRRPLFSFRNLSSQPRGQA
jgi:hypothetical protein